MAAIVGEQGFWSSSANRSEEAVGQKHRGGVVLEMAYDPKVRHHWQMMSIVCTPQDDPVDAGRIVAVCELCGTVRSYEIASATNQMILGGVCPGTSPEPA